ncbi:Superoxide dismutase [Dirofilaria immitis]
MAHLILAHAIYLYLSQIDMQFKEIGSKRLLMNMIIGVAGRLLIGKNYGLNVRQLKHTLPDLPYDYGALEPILSAEIMQVHHGKHHAAYVNALNQAEEKVKEALIKGDTQTAVTATKLMNFNAGGHINHTMFWEGLTGVKDSGEPNSELMTAIKKDFGSFETMKDKLSAKTIAIQGSGWGWLAYDKEMKRLQLACCPNQDLLESTTENSLRAAYTMLFELQPKFTLLSS